MHVDEALVGGKQISPPLLFALHCAKNKFLLFFVQRRSKNLISFSQYLPSHQVHVSLLSEAQRYVVPASESVTDRGQFRCSARGTRKKHRYECSRVQT